MLVIVGILWRITCFCVWGHPQNMFGSDGGEGVRPTVTMARPGKNVELGNQVAGKLKDLEGNSYFFLYKSHILEGKFDSLEEN